MKRIISLAVAAAALAGLAVPFAVFMNRPPVLIVAEGSMVALCGEARTRKQNFHSSISIFRRVKTVLVADNSSPDIVIFAVTEADSKPYCVLFPRVYFAAAERYHEEHPEIPVVLSGGFAEPSALPAPADFFYVYRTDRDTDLYRAGLMAGILGGAGRNAAGAEADSQPAEEKNVVLLAERQVRTPQRDIFSKGVSETGLQKPVIFAASASSVPDAGKISCVALTGAGFEYMEKNPRVPLILFSWIDPAFTPREVKVIFDDSPWSIAVPALRLAISKQAEAVIPSKALIFSGKIADKDAFRMLKKSAAKPLEM